MLEDLGDSAALNPVARSNVFLTSIGMLPMILTDCLAIDIKETLFALFLCFTRRSWGMLELCKLGMI